MARENAINNKTEELTIDPGASGDSFVQFDINATGEFRIGVDDDDGDSFKISQGSALGTNDTLAITAAGEIRKPLQPAFLAILTSTNSDVTGDGTQYTIVWDSEIFDQNNDFDGTSTFTAPITGRYFFSIGAEFGDLVSGNTDGYLRITTSNRSYIGSIMSFGAIMNPSNVVSTVFGVFADMDASDTAVATCRVTGGSKVTDLVSNGSTDPRTWFSGYLGV